MSGRPFLLHCSCGRDNVLPSGNYRVLPDWHGKSQIVSASTLKIGKGQPAITPQSAIPLRGWAAVPGTAIQVCFYRNRKAGVNPVLKIVVLDVTDYASTKS
jgi:hypothetical protein